MSHKATNWAFNQRLKPAPKMILMYLADAHNGISGWCFPSIKRIADGCMLSESSIHKHLSQLEEDEGLITRKFRYVKERQTSSEYILHFDKHGGYEKNTPPPEKNTPINQGNITKEVNTPMEYLNEPGGSTKPPKRKPQPVGPDPYQCMTPKRIDPPEAKPVQIPKAVAPIVERWFEVGKRHRPTTAVLRDGVRAIKGILAGTFFDGKSTHQNRMRKYSEAEVLRALDVYNLRRNSPDYQPIKKEFLKNLNLADFFYHWNTYNGHVHNGNGDGGSIFLQCLEGKAVPATERHPELTTFTLDKYENATGKILEHAGAARIANKMMRFWNEKDGWLKQRGIATPKRLVVAWFDMLVTRRGGDWDVGNILSQNAVGAFESYLKEQHGN